MRGVRENEIAPAEEGIIKLNVWVLVAGSEANSRDIGTAAPAYPA